MSEVKCIYNKDGTLYSVAGIVVGPADDDQRRSLIAMSDAAYCAEVARKGHWVDRLAASAEGDVTFEIIPAPGTRRRIAVRRRSTPHSSESCMETNEALKNLLAAIEPFRAFRNDSDELVARVAKMPPIGSGDGSPNLARLEQAVRRALAAVS